MQLPPAFFVSIINVGWLKNGSAISTFFLQKLFFPCNEISFRVTYYMTASVRKLSGRSSGHAATCLKTQRKEAVSWKNSIANMRA